MTAEARPPSAVPPGGCPGWGEVDPVAEPALSAAGWVARFLADPARAEEVMAIYADLGFEVTARPLAPEHVGPLCAACVASACPVYAMIYTRRRAADLEEAP